MTPEAALTETVDFTTVRYGMCATCEEYDPWIASGGVLMAQQAAAISLRAAGDTIPAQAGATELILRAASQDRLPAPFTLPFDAAARQSFDHLVEARNSFMHPRGLDWQVSTGTLALGLLVATRIVRHLILTQPVLADLISPDQQGKVRSNLESIDSWAEFFKEH